MTVGERIKKIRVASGRTQTEVANKCGISKQLLYKYENNVINNIPLERIELLAKTLNTTPSVLMGWSNADYGWKFSDKEGDKIRKARIALGYTRNELAKKVGISPRQISLIESNRGRLPRDILDNILQVLGISLSDLYDFIPAQNDDFLSLTESESENMQEEYLVQFAIELEKQIEVYNWPGNYKEKKEYGERLEEMLVSFNSLNVLGQEKVLAYINGLKNNVKYEIVKSEEE